MDNPLPKAGNMTIAAVSQHGLATVIIYEFAEKPVRINEARSILVIKIVG